MREQAIKKALLVLKKDSPASVWNFLCKEAESEKSTVTLAKKIEQEFPNRAKEASRIVESFLKYEKYEDFYRNTGPTVAQRVATNLKAVLSDLEEALKK